MRNFTKNQAISLVTSMAISLAGMSNVVWASTPPDTTDSSNSASDITAVCTKQEQTKTAKQKAKLLQKQSGVDRSAQKVQWDSLKDQINNLPDDEQSRIDTCVNKKNAQLNADLGGECGHSNIFTGLRGNNCQVAADAVQNNKTRQQAVDAAALATTSVAGTIAANQSSYDSSNTSAQTAQKTMLQTVAVTKMVQAAEQAYSASQLSGAADGAKLASKNLSNQATDQQLKEQCLYSPDEAACNAALTANANRRLTADQYNYLSTGAKEAKTQADAASSAASTQTIGALTNGLVGAITWMQAGRAAQNANIAPALSYGLPGSGSSISGPLVGATLTNSSTGITPSTGSLLPTTGAGGIQSGMLGGQAPLTTPKGTIAATSTVSGGAAIGGGSGGGDSSGKTAPNKPRSGLGNTGVGTVDAGGGALRSAGGLGMKDGGPDTALTDAIKKMLNPDGTQKTEDSRSIASTGAATPGDGESYALPADVSIFQQVTAKIRQQVTNGAI